nr:unnamed protein product [Digitaria exilis]
MSSEVREVKRTFSEKRTLLGHISGSACLLSPSFTRPFFFPSCCLFAGMAVIPAARAKRQGSRKFAAAGWRVNPLGTLPLPCLAPPGPAATTVPVSLLLRPTTGQDANAMPPRERSEPHGSSRAPRRPNAPWEHSTPSIPHGMPAALGVRRQPTRNQLHTATQALATPLHLGNQFIQIIHSHIYGRTDGGSIPIDD